jgi:branched-chain amino acid transport system permease protein
MPILQILRKNRTLWLTLAALIVLFLLAIQGMSTKDWVVTLLRGLSVGAVTFLVASGFSLIFGLLDVLNLAHGTLFMIGAYVGWTVYIRPDTFVDLLPPALLLIAGFVLGPLWEKLLARLHLPARLRQVWPWVGLLAAAGLLMLVLPRYPVTIWNVAEYENSPVTYGFLADQGQRLLPEPLPFTGSPVLVLGGVLLGGLLIAFSLAGLAQARQPAHSAPLPAGQKFPWLALSLAVGLILVGCLIFAFNTPLTQFLFGISTNWLFLIAIVVATFTGAGLGALLESTLIRPLYVRPIYQLMLTLGLSAIGIEVVRAIWGRPEFVMPKPALFTGTGEGCPALTFSDWLANQCTMINILGGRVRVYNEILLPLIGLVVLVTVWLVLQRSRLGMIIRAGVQDREMVEALGINVRRVFTLVFALGVGLAALGGVLAAPSTGLSNGMGEHFFLNALIALAIGGLTSYPGAAVGSILVGLLEQFIIKYGQIGIHLPFTEAVFKPTPPLVPASTVLLMVIILLVLPQGLFGRKE